MRAGKRRDSARPIRLTKEKGEERQTRARWRGTVREERGMGERQREVSEKSMTEDEGKGEN